MTINVLQWNSRGLIGKWAEAKPMFMNNDFQIICVQETHFMATDKYVFRLPRYTAYHEYCPYGGRAGGVTIFVSDNLPHYRIPITSTLQAVVCSVLVHHMRVTVCSLYLSPSDAFTFQDLVDLVDSLPPPFLICTDANSKHYIWGSDSCDRRGDIWADIIHQYGLIVLNDGQPTRINDFTGLESHIDLTVASGALATQLDWNTIKDLHSSDHFPIHIELGRTDLQHVNVPSIFSGWNLRRADWTNFRSNCSVRFDIQDGLNNCDTLTKTIVDTALKYIPARVTNPKFCCPWWNDECREALLMRKRAQNRMRRNRYSEFLRIEYRKAKAAARRVIREAQVASWRELISVFNHRTPLAKLWDILRKFNHKGRVSRPFPVLLENNVVIDEPMDVANTFGQFFAQLSARTTLLADFVQREQMLMNTMPDFDSNNDETYNKDFTLQELSEAIHRSGSTSVGPDKLHYDFFKHMNDDQLNEILLFFNYLWTHDAFPHSWKHSYIIPILKPGKDCNKVTSYRPIQLTSCLSKLMERMIAARFGWCLERYSLLSKYQCAFRKQRSTTDHLVRLDSHIRDGFIHHCSTLAVFLDLKSAYNTVSPAILLHRLYRLGFRGHLMHFCKSYLSGRTFQVRCGLLSDVFEQEHGLVQGGVLSPLLFNVAIDTLFDVIPRDVSCAIYADDCTIWTQGGQLHRLFRRLQRALQSVGQWSRDNGFVFSAEKSQGVLFRRSLRRVDLASLPQLSLNDTPIAMAECVKYLGVWLDAKLSLGVHIKYTKARAVKRIALLKSIAGKGYGADRAVLIRLYKALIRPILEYAMGILDGPGTRIVESLECIQNSALRIATGALRTSPVRGLQVESHVFPLSLRRKELTLRYYLKVKGDASHPCHGALDLDTANHIYGDLSESYVRRISGFPLAYRIHQNISELQFLCPQEIANPRSYTPPWVLPQVEVHMLFDGVKRQVPECDVVEAFRAFTLQFPDFRRFFTDGSKQNGSTGCAFTLNNAYFSHKLHPYISVFTAELFAIREALRYICEHRVPKALICSDSQSALRAIAAHKSEHCVLVEISELLVKVSHIGCTCIFLWIPGHCGIAGNVRADHWAKRAHTKPVMTHINVSYREFLPRIRERVAERFANLWQEYRDTFLKEIKPIAGLWSSSIRTNRREEIVLARLRLGHTVLTHSYIIDRLAPPLCPSCQLPQTVPHVLLDCQKYRRQRQLLQLQCRALNVPMTVSTVLGDGNRSVTDALFRFLKECELLSKL